MTSSYNDSDSDQSWLDQLNDIPATVTVTVSTDCNGVASHDCSNSLKRPHWQPSGASELKRSHTSAYDRSNRTGIVRGPYKNRAYPKVRGVRGPYNKKAKQSDDDAGTSFTNEGAAPLVYAVPKPNRRGPGRPPGRRCKDPQSRAQIVASKFKDNLSFLTCACCPFSGPQHLFLSIEEFRKSNHRALIYNGVRKTNRVQELLSKDSAQTSAYAVEFEQSFTKYGLLKGLNYICKRCRGGLASSCPCEPVNVASLFGDVAQISSDSEEDDEADDEQDNLQASDSDGEGDENDHSKPEDSKQRGRGSLDNSYLNGLLPGTVPEVLKCLNAIEKSMIAKVNTVTKVRLVGSSHYVATTPTYSIINNVLEIYEQLPRMLSETDHATLRTFNGKLTKDYAFRPSKVIAALRWLKENNWLYRDIVIEVPAEWIDEESGELIDVDIPGPTIDLSEEETKEVDIADHTNHSGHDAGGTALEILLMNSIDADISPTVEVLKEALDDGDIGPTATAVATDEIDEPVITVDQLLQKVIERGGDVAFTDANKEEYLLEMSNPHLFPYGRGGPGDDFSAHLDLQGSARVAKFASTALQGGGAFKRFQNDFRFIALCYYTSMRKRLSGVSYAAHRKDLDDVSPFQQEAIQMVRDGDQSSAAAPATDHEVASDQVPMVTVEPEVPMALADPPNQVTVADIAALRDCLMTNATPPAHLIRLVNRLSVYAHPLPGTSLYMMQERKFLHSAIASPIYDKNPWIHFISLGNCDLFEEHLFRCIFNDGNGKVVDYDGNVLSEQEGKQFLRDLNKAKRGQLLSRYPAFAIRMFKIKMEIILNDVLGGKDGSLGDQFDYWARLEFSRSHNAHLHMLQSIRNGLRCGDNIAISKDSERIIPELNEMIKATCTAKLIPPSASVEAETPLLCQPCYESTEPSEVCLTPFKTWNCGRFPTGKEFEWRPCNCGLGREPHGSKQQAFTDAEDPRRLPFNGELDYTYRGGIFADSRVQNLCRNLQLANQIHYCCFTCFKYNSRCICRFMFPRVMAELRARFRRDYADATDPEAEGLNNCYLAMRKDGRTRKRMVVVPPVNNAHLNNHPSDPLFIAAHHGNCDVKYMPESTGTVEYCTSYSTKAEKQDFNTIANIFSKRLAGINRAGKEMTDLQKLNTVGKAIIDSEQASATQMIMVLCSLKFIEYNRPRENVNPLRRDLIRIRVLPSQVRQFAADSQSALSTGVDSHFGRRDAYSTYLKQVQYLTGDVGAVTYYFFRTAYTSQLVTQKIEKKVSGLSAPLTVDLDTGFISPTSKSFRIDGYYYVRRRKDAVIHCTPHVPIDYNDDNACYAILLLHHPWPDGEESKIVPSGVTASYHLADLMRRQLLLPHVSKTLKGIQQSEAFLAQQREDMILEGRIQEDALYVQPVVYEGDDLEAENVGDVCRTGVEHEAGVVDVDALVAISDGDASDSDDDDTERVGETASNVLASELLNLSIHGTSLNSDERANAKAFIENARKQYAERHKLINGATVSRAHGEPAYITPPSIVFENAAYVPIDNYEEVADALKVRLSKFNDEQWMAYRKAEQYLDSTMDGDGGQLLMFMSGEGGCGKSYVIEAIDMLARLKFGKGRGKYGPIAKWAPTGSSGYIINGCTWQSGCHLSGFTGENIQYRGIGLDLYDAYAIVLDKVSMVGLEDIWKMSEIVANARATQVSDPSEQDRIRQLPFGGLLVIFCGDFFQLPPPGAGRTPIFERYPKSEEGKKGRAIWEKLNAYVCLVDNKRIALPKPEELEPSESPDGFGLESESDSGVMACDDTPESALEDRETVEDKWFASTLSLLRQGFVDVDTLSYLNSHCLLTSNAYNSRTQHPDAVWLSPVHDITKEVNEKAFQSLVAEGNFHYRCIALHDQGGLPLPSMEHLKKCFKVTDPNPKKYGATHLDLAIGMRVKLHDNLAPELALFNGASGKVVDIAFPDYIEPNVHKLIPDKSDNMAKLANAHRPLPIVSVKIDNDKLDDSLFPGGIVKFVAAKKYLCGRGRHAIYRTQLPLTPCHASTVHSAQGLTAKSPGGIIYHSGRRRFACGLAYVALSRCRKLRDVKLARPLKSEDFTSHDRTRDKIKEEYARLEELFPQPRTSKEVLNEQKRLQKKYRAQLLFLDSVR